MSVMLVVNLYVAFSSKNRKARLSHFPKGRLGKLTLVRTIRLSVFSNLCVVWGRIDWFDGSPRHCMPQSAFETLLGS